MGMRLHIRVFSSAFIIIFSILQIHPILIDYEFKKQQSIIEAKKPGCTKSKKPVCTRNKCSLPVSSDEKEDCNNNGCNPFVPCNMGFCCYLVENAFAYSIHSIVSQKVFFHFNDNRIQNTLSECWHPPEVIS